MLRETLLRPESSDCGRSFGVSSCRLDEVENVRLTAVSDYLQRVSGTSHK